MIRRIVKLWADLWAGRIPLADAFWTYAVFWGFLINVSTSLGTLALVVAEVPGWLAVVAHLLPLPWNLLVLVAVWRSATDPAVPRPLALAVRVITCVWTGALSAT